MKKYIVVTLQFEGIHCWPSCPIDEVGFLRTPHRHVFHVRAKKEVTHNEREIEIIMFKRSILEFIRTDLYLKNSKGELGKIDLGAMSCESMAETICNHFDCKSVQVLEDNENGTEVHR